MYILKSLLVISILFQVSIAALRNCSISHTKSAVCFKNETAYSNPFPAILGVQVHLKDIIEVNEQKNSISIQMELWTFWSDHRLALSDGEIEG